MISNLYSDRNKPKSVDEVVIFDELPRKLRVQFYFILKDILYDYDPHYAKIHELLCRKYGKLSLSSRYALGDYDKEALEEALTKPNYNFNLIFDMVELAIRYQIDQMLKDGYEGEEINEFIEEVQKSINTCFKESSMGYEIVNCQIIRKDSEITFTEIIEPTINLTYNDLFENVNVDFVDAIKEYQNGDNKNCIVKLLSCFDNEIVPQEMKSEFTSLNSLLQSGILPVRNNFGGHGDGGEEKVVEDYLARYAINITGSCILFVIEASGL